MVTDGLRCDRYTACHSDRVKRVRWGCMQLGMIGLGRMGANMVRRLTRGGHQCVVYDRSAQSVQQLAAEGAPGIHHAGGFCEQAIDSARHLADGAGRGGGCDAARAHAALEAGDIVIDGGNSYYIDDIRRAKESGAQRHSIRRRRHQRRRVGPGARLLPDDRRRTADMVKHLDPIFKTLAPGRGNIERTPGREKSAGGTSEEGYLHCGPVGRGAFREDGAQRNRIRAHGGLRRRA